MYLIYTISYASAMICGPLTMICLCCVACSGIPMLAAFIMTGIRIVGSAGSTCRENVTEYSISADDATLVSSFALDGDLARKLWIAGMATWCPMLCCGQVGIMMGIGGWMACMGKDAGSLPMGNFVRM